ncbi:MAG: hypothetical protein ABIB98_00885 [bacterium]
MKLLNTRIKKMNSFQISLLLFLFSFSVYFFGWLFLYKAGINEILVQSADAVPSTYLPVSILKEGNFDLNEYYDFFRKTWPDGDDKKAKPYYLAFSKKGDIVSYFPTMNAVLSLPFYLPLIFIKVSPGSDLIPIFGRVASSFFSALSGIFVYLTVFEILKSRKKSLLIFISYAFGTITWGLSSQTLWQHGVSQALLALAMFFLVKGLMDEKSAKFIKFSGLALSLATLTRPTGLIFALPITVFVFLKWRKEFVKFIVFSLIPLIFQFWYNYEYFGGILKHSYESQQFTNWTGKFPEGFFGLWLSPSKGLLPYSPIFIFSLIGIYFIWFKKTKLKEDMVLLFKIFSVCIFLFTLVMGRWVHWYGGWGFGYRMAVDIIPFLIIFLIPVLQSPVWKVFKFGYFPFLLWAIIVEISGLVFDFRHWHTLYDNGPIDTGWLWSIKNSEIAYYFRRFLLKFK